MTAASDLNIVIQQGGAVRETQAPRAQPVNSDQMADVVKKMHEEDRVTIQQSEETQDLRLKEKKEREEREKKEKEKRKNAVGKNESEPEDAETPGDDEDEPGQLVDTVV